MKRCFLFWLTLLFSTGVWAVTYTVNISSSDNDLGYVTVDISEPGDVDEETYYDTDGTGEVEFEVAKNRTLTLNVYVNDDALYYFAGWSDGKTETTRTLKVTKDLSLTANFEAYPTYTICVEANIDGAGTVDVDGELCESNLLEGDKVWLNAEAEEGYVFLRWEDDGTGYDQTYRQVTVTN
ncbi:MAG: hypothetical protein IJT35_00305, partial [Paludibacteraceae bacterium]|nr:hypothetical protein [Paludibacteraceae bacterium]